MNKEHLDKYYAPEVILGKANATDAEKIIELSNACRKYAERVGELEVMPQKIDAALREHEEKQRVSHYASESERLVYVLRSYQDTATRALASAERFRDEMSIWLRALSLTLTMTGNAQTHGEKNARLRGAIEVVEKIYGDIRDLKFDFSRGYWRWMDRYDAFKSDYPVRQLLDRINTLTAELETEKKNNAQRQAQETTEGEATT